LTFALDHEMIGDARHIRMAQARQDRGLAPELPGVLLRREEILLHGDRHAQIDVESPIDGAHAALAKDTFNPITMAENTSGLERHAYLGRGKCSLTVSIVAKRKGFDYQERHPRRRCKQFGRPASRRGQDEMRERVPLC